MEDTIKILLFKKQYTMEQRTISGLKAGLGAIVLGLSSSAYATEVHWNYDNQGAEWGTLLNEHGEVAFPTCASGTMQSPIDIKKRVKKADLDEITFNYNELDLNVLNNGHTLEVEVHNGSHIIIGGERFDLLQFHFHTPSEHTVKGKHAEMEAHFVHMSSDFQFAVVGVLIEADEDDAHATFANILHNQPVDANGEPTEGHTETHISISPTAFLPKAKERDEFYHYMGSLTTPPCSEGLRWYVMDEEIEFSEEQVAEFSHVVHGANARATQPLYGRTVVKADD
jgi:carbonic anhydrase